MVQNLSNAYQGQLHGKIFLNSMNILVDIAILKSMVTTIMCHLAGVRIDPPHSLACFKRRLNRAVLRVRPKNRGPVSQQVWHDKDPSLPAQRPLA
jgi:hypothetical protein